MKQPEYTIEQFTSIIRSIGTGWFFNDDVEQVYEGEPFKVLQSNQSIHQAELQGNIIGNKFTSKDQVYEGTIDTHTPFNNMEAVAINCIDGVIILSKYPLEHIGRRRIEGYWYSEYTPQFKRPQPNQLTDSEAKNIFGLIKAKEKECEKRAFRGYSISRIDKKTLVGNSEFYHNHWLWPEGFAEHYVLKHKVKPTDDFLTFIGWKSS